MLHGVLVFDSSRGTLLYQRRFQPQFALPGAGKDPNLADSIGLALQLYAFNRFCSDLPGEQQLDYFQLGENNAVFFAAADKSQVVLALFGDLPREFGQRIAASLLEAFVRGEPSPRDISSCMASALDEVIDWLVGAIADALPEAPSWLAVLAPNLAMESRARSASCAHSPREAPREVNSEPSRRSVTAETQGTAFTPRPPTQPPPDGRGRSSLSRRIMQRMSGTSPRTTSNDEAAPELESGRAEDGSARTGKRNWLNWRGRSRSEIRSDAETALLTELPAEHEPTPRKTLFFYSGLPISCADGAGSDGAAAEWTTPQQSSLERFASGLERAAPHTGGSDAVVVGLSLVWPGAAPEKTGVVPPRSAAFFQVDGQIIVAVPLQALGHTAADAGADTAIGDREKVLVCEYRRALDPGLRTLAAFLDFLARLSPRT